MMDTRHALVEVCEPRGKKDTPFLPPPGLPFHSPRIFRRGAERPKEKDVTWEGWPAKARPRRSQDRLARIRNCERSIISGCRLAESWHRRGRGHAQPKEKPWRCACRDLPLRSCQETGPVLSLAPRAEAVLSSLFLRR
ncbi:hypothetical protein MTO96_020257 [Rhipicephalus appendiculatus]